MDFGARLKTLRIQRGLTQIGLCEKIGVTSVTLGNWERGVKKPTMDAIIALGDALSVSLDELLGTSSENHIPNTAFILSTTEHKLLTDFRTLDSYGKKAVSTLCKLESERCMAEPQRQIQNIIDLQTVKRERYIPRYYTPPAAGSSVPLDGEDFEMILVDDSVPEEADYAVNVQGESMAPYIHDGDMVFVQKDAELSVGDVGIFSVDGAMYCKQYYPDGNGGLILVSANPELRHTNVIIGPDSNQTVRACGKVLLNQHIALPDYLFNS